MRTAVARSIFERVPLQAARRAMGGTPVRGVLFGRELFLFAREGHELLRIEPQIGPGGELELGYFLRDPELLGVWLGRLRKPPRPSPLRVRSGRARR
ncbi:MAG TPA: hypothetical protein VEN81_17320 [Planctomycetota bacterium]|nr:hypothetical protein [Planctomycetota bacterium]